MFSKPTTEMVGLFVLLEKEIQHEHFGRSSSVYGYVGNLYVKKQGTPYLNNTSSSCK